MKAIKVYLDEKEIQNLKLKAEQLGFVGRGWLSQFIRRIAREPIVFIDENVKAVTSLFSLKEK